MFGQGVLLRNGCGSKLDHQGTAGFSPCFHLPGFHFGCLFLTHPQMGMSNLFGWLPFGKPPSKQALIPSTPSLNLGVGFGFMCGSCVHVGGSCQYLLNASPFKVKSSPQPKSNPEIDRPDPKPFQPTKKSPSAAIHPRHFEWKIRPTKPLSRSEAAPHKAGGGPREGLCDPNPKRPRSNRKFRPLEGGKTRIEFVHSRLCVCVCVCVRACVRAWVGVCVCGVCFVFLSSPLGQNTMFPVVTSIPFKSNIGKYDIFLSKWKTTMVVS